MTIEQLQAFIDTKPDIRQLINAIVDYIQANPSVGSANIYNSDGTLAGSRTINLDGSSLTVVNIEDPVLLLNKLDVDTGDIYSAILGPEAETIIQLLKKVGGEFVIFYGAERHLFNSDAEITDNTKGFIISSPNSTRYRIKVANDGTLSTEAV